MTDNTIKLCSGRGEYHSDGGSNPKPLRGITLDAIEKMLTKPQRCEKEKGEWVIFTTALTRQKHKLVEADARYYALWLDIDEMQGVALENLANQFAELIDGYLWAYTTKRATAENQKARIVIPLNAPITLDDFERYQTVINDKLESLGVIPDRNNQKPSQFCYLPNAGAYYQHYVIGEAWQAINPLECFKSELIALEQREADQLQQRKIELQQRISTTAKRMASNQLSPINAFNEAFTVIDMLERNSYKRKGEGRYLSPFSTSGSAGITLLDDGRIYSHGTSDPLADGLPHDAFDLFKTLEHNGDQTKALKAAGAMFTTQDGLTLTKANQRTFMQQQADHATLISFDRLTCNERPVKAPILVDADGVISEQPNEVETLEIESYDTFKATGLVIATDCKQAKWRLMETYCRDYLHLIEGADELAKLCGDVVEGGLIVVLTQQAATYAGMESNSVRVATIDHNELINRGNGAFVKQLISAIKPYFEDQPIRNSPRFWHYNYDKHGNQTTPKETIENYKALLAWEGISLRYMKIGRTIEWRDGYGCKGDSAESDRLTQLISAAKQYGLPTNLITDYVARVASENEFNPVLAFITRQQWDQQKDYIGQLFSTLTLADDFDPSLALSYLRKWMISAVMLAVQDPPQEAHGVFILQSLNHGAGKGRWFQRLVEGIDPDLLGTGGIDARNKDDLIRIGKKWIFELSEIESTMSRREIGELKAFITSKVDEVRAPYARVAQKLPRRTALCGSANDKQFLSDPTGSRRFWIVPITKADYQHTVNMQQAWAQAYHLYLAGEPYYLNDEEVQKVTNANDEHFQALCPIQEALEANYRWDDPRETWKNFLTTTDALKFCFSNPNYEPNGSDLKKAGTFLTKRCGARKARKDKGKNIYGYWMPDRYSKYL
jgi:hypothetical protein